MLIYHIINVVYDLQYDIHFDLHTLVTVTTSLNAVVLIWTLFILNTFPNARFKSSLNVKCGFVLL